MDNPIEHSQLGGIAKDHGAEPGAIKPPAGVEHAGPERLHHAGQPGRARLNHLPGQRVSVHQDGTELRQA